MAMHWTEERAARAELGKAFRTAGACLYGWHDDHSDAMTDYYDPESWWGLATYKGYVIVAGAYPRRWYPEDGTPVEFQQNAKGKTWHVEFNGEIIASGTGLSKCSRHTYSYQHGISRDLRDSSQMARDGAAELVQKIFRIIDRHAAGQTRPNRRNRADSARTEGSTESRTVYQDADYRVEYRGEWTWMFFADKPNAEVRSILKETGFRWSRNSEGWYKPALVSLEELTGEAQPEVGVLMYAEPIGPKPAPRAYPPMISRHSPHQEQIRRLKGQGW